MLILQKKTQVEEPTLNPTLVIFKARIHVIRYIFLIQHHELRIREGKKSTLAVRGCATLLN